MRIRKHIQRAYYFTQRNLVRRFPVEVLRALPHDSRSYTQGLAFHDGFLYESTGLKNQSSLRRIDITNGKVIKIVDISEIWAEGIAIGDGVIVQLSWKDGKANRFLIPELEIATPWKYHGEGWGLSSGEDCGFWMSNGSSTLTYLDSTFRPKKSIRAHIWRLPLRHLNDIEYANGYIYANIWYQDDIAMINSETGRVKCLFNCRHLRRHAEADNRHFVLNGIAYSERTGSFYVTGKNWRYLYEIRLRRNAARLHSI